MKKNYPFFSIVLFLSIFSTTAFSQTFRPPHVSNLVLWLKADSLTTTTGVPLVVSDWGDASGNSNNCTQGTAANRPLYLSSVSNLNNKPALDFDGNNDFFSGTTIAGLDTSSMTVFTVVTGDTIISTAGPGIFTVGPITTGYWFRRHGASQRLEVYNKNSNYGSANNSLPNLGFGPKILCMVKNKGVRADLYINTASNGFTTVTTATAAFTNAAYRVGALNSGGNYNGKIAEVIVYNKALSASERQNVENYIIRKYAPPVSLGPDIIKNNFCSTTLDAGARFASFLWSPGGATTQTLTVTKSGTYIVAATNVFGIVSRDTIIVTFPNSKLNRGDTTVCQGVSFQVKPRCSPLSNYTFVWSTGSTDSVITVSQAGNYFVTINGTCPTISDTLTLTVDQFPSHVSLGNDTSFCSGKSIKVHHPGYPIQSYLWKGGSTADSLIVNTTDDYWVQATNSGGCIGRDTVHVSITGQSPTALFRADSVCYSDSTHFTDLSGVSPGTITGWNWNFGDGNTSVLQHPVHRYAAAGIYTVTLKATSNAGCDHTVSKQVIVYKKPTAQFTTSTACSGVAYQFTDQSTIGSGSSITGWNWNFGDGFTSATQNPLHNYSSAAVFPVSLKVTSNNGCRDSVVHNITVVSTSPTPLAFNLIAPPEPGISSDTNVTFSWSVSTNASVYTLQVADDSVFSAGLRNYTGITGTSRTVGLPGNHNYFWRVVALNPCNNSYTSVYHHLRVFNPTNLNGLKLWLRADSNVSHPGGSVTAWNDCSGGNHHAVQTTPANQPTYINSMNMLNGKPAIRFDGVNDFMSSVAGDSIAGIGKSPMSLFVVATGDSIGNIGPSIFSIGTVTKGFWFTRYGTNKCLLIYNNNSNYYGTANTLTNLAFNPKIMCQIKKYPDSCRLYLNCNPNGSTGSSVISGNFTNDVYRLGQANGGASYYKGNFAEVILYNTALTPSDRVSVENYLKNKYAPPVNLGQNITKTNFCATTLDAGARFVNFLWSTGATTQTISVNNTGSYWVQVTSTFGTISRDTIVVTYPNTHLNHGDTTICQGDAFQIKPRCSPLSNYTFNWSTGSTDSVITISQAGNYFVTITGGGCSKMSDTLTLTLDMFPTHISLGNDTSFCSGKSIKVYHPGYPIQSYLWKGGSTADSLIVNTTGDYWITAVNNRGCIGRDTVNVTITGQSPVALFTADSACFSDSTHFTDLSGVQLPDTVTQWNWNFGDGHTSTLQHPAHLYAAAGTYNVILKATTNAGCDHTISRQVIVYPKPAAHFSTTTACSGIAYQFTDQSTVGSGSTISGWNWNFGDNGTSASQNPQHNYSGASVYQVSLKVTTSHGCTDSTVNSITVVATSPVPQAFSLIAPSDHAISSDTTITFNWANSQNASSYLLQFANDSVFQSGVLNFPGISGTSYTATLAGNHLYFWRVIAYNPCNNTDTSSYRHLKLFSPANIPGLQLWLRSDANVNHNLGFVSDWNDCSGGNHHAHQSTSGNQPAYLNSVPLLNGKPAIRFDGVNDFMASAAGDSLPNIGKTSMSVFVMGSGDSVGSVIPAMFSINTITKGFWFIRSGANKCLMVYNNNSNYYGTANSLTNHAFNPKIMCQIKKYNDTCRLFLNTLPNGISVATLIKGPFTNDVYRLGHANGGANYFKGNFAEVLIYNTALNPTERIAVEQYLKYKYAPPMNLGPDIVKQNFCPTVLDAGGRFVHYLWSTGDTTQTISINNSGSYSVRGTNIFGDISHDTIVVTYPNRHLNTTSATVCMGDSIMLKPQTGHLDKYTLTWHPNASSDSTIYAKNPGQYWATIADSVGACPVNSDTATIVIDSLIHHFTLGNDTSMCAGYILQPKHQGYTIPTYVWMDNSTDSTITVWTSGNYSVTATDIHGCQAFDSVNVTVTGWAPVAIFTADTVCLGNATDFSDHSTVISPSYLVSWAWDFGDGNTSAVPSPSHTYSTAGTYQASLTVVTNVGCQHTLTKAVIVNQPPMAYFSATTACTSTPYQFFDGSIAAPGDSITGWLWHFGDGSSAIIKDPAHQYLIAGNYSPDLMVTTIKGCSSTYSSSITVVSSSLPPSPFSLLAPLHNFLFSVPTVNFSWTVSTNADHYNLYVAEDSLFSINLQTYFNINSPAYTGNFTMNKTYWWKVVAFDVCGATYTTSVRKFRTFSPSGVPGMKLWLKGDAGITQVGGFVTQWKDQSGHNNDAIQNVTADRPLYKASVDTLNGYPAVYFNGGNKFLTGTTIPLIDSSSVTLFVVASGNSSTLGTYNGLFSINSTADGFCLARVISSSSCLRFINKNQTISSSINSLPLSGFNPAILCVAKTYGAKAENYINGGIDGTSTNSTLSGPFVNGDYKIGCIGTSSFYKGNIAEIMLFNSILSVSDRKNVESYFRYKYAPPVNLGPDINIAYGLCDTLLNAGPRFTSYMWSTGETTSSINAGSGTYWVSVTDIFGYVSKDTINVTKPSLHIADTAFCIYSSAQVSTGFGSGYNYLWADSTTAPVYTADSAGTFWVRVSDTIGCYAIDTFQVAVDSFAVQASLGPDRKLCQGNTIGLMSGAQQAVTYLWNTGSGSSLILINDPPGTTPVYWLTVTDHNGCAAIDTVQLTINGVAPVPMFTSDTACFGVQTHFTDLSSVVAPYTITDWQWDFGDSTTSATPNPQHTYSGFGIYYSTLTVTTDSGCVSNITRPVAVYSLPDVHFLPFIGCSGVPVPFTDMSTDAFGGITSWNWNFGDPSSGTSDSSTLENPGHNYILPGSYPVTLIVSSAAGCADTITAAVLIKESPDINFNWTQSCEGTPVFFTNLTTTDPWAQITDLKWNFGDGDSSTFDNPSHNYSGAGTYNVTLTVRALSGCQISLTKQVEVHAIPAADFSVSDLCEGIPGNFTDASIITNDTISQWHWEFDSVGNSYNQNPAFMFPDTGNYNVTLEVTSNAGCSGTRTQQVHVYPRPHAAFTFTPAYGVPPLTVTFTNTSTGATSYFWDFGDGTTDLSQNPQHIYTAEGIYSVLLIVSNVNNCPDTAIGTVYVIPTTLDIAVISVNADHDGEFLRFTATIKNLGTRGVDEIDLSAQLNKGSIIKETWAGTMMPGDAVIYNFNAEFMVPPGGTADYICINASVPGTQPDDKPGNNEQCLVLRDIFIVSQAYPDPVTDQVNLDVIIPYAEQIDIVLYNENGQKLGTAFSGQASEGYNNFVIPTGFLSQGVYALQVVFRDKTEVRKFVKF